MAILGTNAQDVLECSTKPSFKVQLQDRLSVFCSFHVPHIAVGLIPCGICFVCVCFLTPWVVFFVLLEALGRSENRRDGGYKHSWSFSFLGDEDRRPE